jgi:hypothetical protein
MIKLLQNSRDSSQTPTHWNRIPPLLMGREEIIKGEKNGKRDDMSDL